MRSREPEIEYLRRIERLAQAVVAEAGVEGWLEFGDEGDAADVPLHRAVNELATYLRFTHHADDDCVSHA